MIVNNPEAAYNLCQDYLPDCSEPTATEFREQHDDFNAGYRGADSSDILDREGLSPQQYLEFTERERLSPPPPVTSKQYLSQKYLIFSQTSLGTRTN